MPGVVISVNLPQNRKDVGSLTITDSAGKILLSSVRVLGRADRKTAEKKGNPSGAQLNGYGDTPTGGYQVTQIFSTGAGTAYAVESYGANGAIRLNPTSGTALLAKLNGRTGLLIHGGRARQDGKLVPTNGCLRVSDADMLRIIKAIVSASQNAEQNRCEVLDVTLSVEPSAQDQGVDDGDPPPTTPSAPILS